MIFVDTNYFLRLLLKDVDLQHQKAKKLFQKAALGQVKLFTSIIVFFEIYWVLSSFYQQKKHQIVKILNNILKMDFVKISERKLLEKSLKTFSKSNLELEDCFNLVYAKTNKAGKLATFDKKLLRRF